MPTLEKGFWVVVVVRKGVAPLKSYTGVIQEVDEHGIRLRLIDWVTDSILGYDLYVPWPMLGCCLVATPEHDIRDFGKSGARWQEELRLKDE